MPQALMRPHLVVMLDKFGHHVSKVTAAEDQDVVERLSTCGAHPSLGKCIRPRSAEWSLDNLDALSPQDFVKGSREFRVAVTEQKPGSECAILGVPGEMARLLGDPGAGGMWAVQPAKCTRRLPISMKNRTYSVWSQTVSTVKKSVARIC